MESRLSCGVALRTMFCATFSSMASRTAGVIDEMSAEIVTESAA